MQKFTKRFLLFILISGIAFNGNTQSLQYIHKYKPLAEKLSKEYQIPVSVILGIAVIESGAGKSRNCTLLNNHFGFVGKHHIKKKGFRSKFKQYPNAEASYRDFCVRVSRKTFYQSLKGNQDYSLWIEALSKSGYSEYPVKWKKLIYNAIKRYKLGVPKTSPEKDELQQKDSSVSAVYNSYTIYPFI